MNALLTNIKLNAVPTSEKNLNTTLSSKIDVAKNVNSEDFGLMMKKTLSADAGSSLLLTESTEIKNNATDLMADENSITDVTQMGNEFAIHEDLINHQATITRIGENLPANGNSLPFWVDLSAPVALERNNRIKPLQQSSQATRVVQTITEGLNPQGTLSNSVQLESNAPFLDNDEFDFLTTKTLAFNALQHSASDSASTRLQSTLANPINANPILTSVLSGNLEKLLMTNPNSSAEWGSALGDRVSLMLNQKQRLATIRLDPPSLGKMDIQILVKDDVTNVTINTQHAQTRDMVDSASYRLREILQDAGYQNVNVDVSHQSDQQKNAAQFGNGTDANDGLDSDVAPDADKLSMTVQANLPDSLVDFFA
jgi:flagellar hook-length control protein FliK